jgi:hypothetical protein
MRDLSDVTAYLGCAIFFWGAVIVIIGALLGFALASLIM